MEEDSEVVRIRNAETTKSLLQQRNAVLTDINKMRLVMQQLGELQVGNLDLPDGGEQVQQAVDALKICEFLELHNDNEKQQQPDYLLNLTNCTTELSYMERKAVRQQLIADLQQNLKAMRVWRHKLGDEFPELFRTKDNGNLTDMLEIPTALQRNVELEKLRCEKLENLLKIRNRKCGLLKMAAELKMGTYLGQKIEILYSEAKVNHTKANVLHCFMVNELMSRSEHIHKALHEVEAYVNETVESLESAGL